MRARCQTRPDRGFRRVSRMELPRLAPKGVAKLLRDAEPIPACDCRGIPDAPGLYMFEEGDRIMWVGKATRLRQRIEHHTHHHHKGRHRTTSLLASTLANNMAARRTGLEMDAGNPAFREGVLEAASRIRDRMVIRHVVLEESDKAWRAACERAAIRALAPEYNRR